MSFLFGSASWSRSGTGYERTWRLGPFTLFRRVEDQAWTKFYTDRRIETGNSAWSKGPHFALAFVRTRHVFNKGVRS